MAHSFPYNTINRQQSTRVSSIPARAILVKTYFVFAGSQRSNKTKPNPTSKSLEPSRLPLSFSTGTVGTILSWPSDLTPKFKSTVHPVLHFPHVHVPPLPRKPKPAFFAFSGPHFPRHVTGLAGHHVITNQPLIESLYFQLINVNTSSWVARVLLHFIFHELDFKLPLYPSSDTHHVLNFRGILGIISQSLIYGSMFGWSMNII